MSEDEIIDLEKELQDEEIAKKSKRIRLIVKLGVFITVTVGSTIAIILTILGA